MRTAGGGPFSGSLVIAADDITVGPPVLGVVVSDPPGSQPLVEFSAGAAAGGPPEYARSYFGARYLASDVGRFTTVDPVYTWKENLGDPQRWNRYAYVRNNPLRFTDPDGRQIEAEYDQKKGTLTLVDLDTKKQVVIKVESGGKPYGDPIPAGTWEILEQRRRPDFFRLDKRDSTPYDDKDDKTGRGQFRLHKPGRTIGCIAAKDWNEWKEAKELIEQTKTTVVPDNAVPWWHLKAETVAKYGTLTVR